MELEKGSVNLNEARIIILGEKGAGKTSLARRLIDPNAPMPYDEESTLGVDTSVWQVGEVDNLVNVHIWNFAGHVVTHAVHRCFLSERCLYVIVYDGRTERRNFLEYWLDNVKNYSGNAPVRIIVNIFHGNKPDIAENALRKKYPFIQDFIYFSIREDKVELEKLRSEISDFVLSNPMWNRQFIPETYYIVKSHLDSLFQNDKRDYIDKVELESIACEHGIIEHDEQEKLFDALHTLGICLWYKDIKEFNSVILNPDWIANGIYKSINWAANRSEYRIFIKDYVGIFADEKDRYPADKFREILNLMREYELAYSADNDSIILPHLLDEDRPAELPPFSDDSLMIKYVSESPLPPSTVCRLIVRHHGEIRNISEVWRFGVVLKYGVDTIATVIEDNRIISITVEGSKQSEYITMLRSSLNDIFDSYKSDKPVLQYRVILPNEFKQLGANQQQGIDVYRKIMLSEPEIISFDKSGRDYYHFDSGSNISLTTTIKQYRISGNNEIVPLIYPSYESIYTLFRQAIYDLNYEEAHLYLPKLESANNERYDKLISELVFLFGSEENEKIWTRQSTKCKSTLWWLLTLDLSFDIDTKEEKTQEDVSEDTQNKINELKNGTPIKTTRKKKSPQEIGDDLERAVLTLIKEFFDISDEEESERVLRELGRQKSGFQFGFDIDFKYRDESGSECFCKIECKDKKDIKMGDVTGKLEQALIDGQEFHHWILISPTGKVSNDIKSRLPVWEEQNRWYPIQKVQIWTEANFVDQLFSLVPEIYTYYYPNGTLNPSLEQRFEIAKEWKQKLTPAIPLPLAWKIYLREHQKLLTHSERGEQNKSGSKIINKQIINDYEELYSRRIKIKCLDESRTPLGISAEKYIVDWAYNDSIGTMFVLGDFGDGKTFLTYSVARQLTEDFVKSTSNGIIPIRLTLKDLSEQINAETFLINRLANFSATIGEYGDIKEKFKLLIILDGFDEMSTGMDSATITKNIQRLWKCFNYFKGLKLLISSRSTLFKKYKRDLISRINQHEIIYIAPIEPQEKINFLEEYAKTHNVLNNFYKLRDTNDLLGLASKPIFLDMMKIFMLKGSIKEADNLSIYSHYVDIILERKKDIQYDRDNDNETVDFEHTAIGVEKLMEDFALISFEKAQKGISGITFDDLKEALSEYQANPVAELLWRKLVNPSLEDNEEAEERVINRSLLKETESGYTHCHRSMQEYFVAKGICRWLKETPKKVADYLSEVGLTFETVNFAGQILKSFSEIDSIQIKQRLVSMIERTRNESADNKSIARLGSVAINLYFNAWHELPEIENWCDLVLNNANLPTADFSNKALNRTLFRYANLDNVDFTNAVLSECDLTGVKFEETQDICAMSVITEDKSYLYAIYSDGKLRKWDIYSVQNKYDELADFKAEPSIKMSLMNNELIIRHDRHLYFTRTINEQIETHNCVNYDKRTTVFDIKENWVLFARNEVISLYDGSVISPV